MKKLLFLASFVAIVMSFVACESENVEAARFQYDANGRCYQSDAQPISYAEFLKYAEGNGWEHVSTHEIDENGRVLEKNYYEGLDGASSHDYYFEKDRYSYDYFSFPYGTMYSTSSYIYQEDGNRIGHINRFDDSFFTQFQVLSIDENELQVVQYLAYRAGENARNIYGLVTYRKMTDEEREDYLRGYNNYEAREMDGSFVFRKFGDITEEDFLKEVVGYGWQWGHTWEISEDTTYRPEVTYYADQDEASHYYFEKDVLTRFYRTEDGEFVHSKEPYTLMLDEFPYKLVNEATKDTLYLYFAQNPEFSFREVLDIRDGKPVWGFSSYRRMYDKKLEQFREKYSTEVKHP
jgi:hypothetical protein